MDKIRELSGDWTTHMAAGVFATWSHENEIFMVLFIVLIVVIATVHIYNVVHKIVFRHQTKELCTLRRSC
jgi:hypothetical protein